MRVHHSNRRPRRWPISTALAVTALLAVSACTADGSPEEDSLERFHDQELTWESCEGKEPSDVEKELFVDPFECAALEVPLDYDDTDGETIDIGLMRLPAKGDTDERVGSLVLNPGGPGGPGTAQAAVASVAFKDTPVAERFDVVGFDPRGVGTSEPDVKCFTDEEQDAGDNQVTLLGSAGEWDEQDVRDLRDRCAERTGGEEMLGAVGTRNVAQDMDVLREALGDEELTFAGQSYGTRLGAVYAEMFPENVRAMVLDGAVDPTQGTAERRRDLHEGFQRSFDLMAADCAEQEDCPLGDDPEQATEVFQDIVRPLVDDPVPAGDGRTLGFNLATGGVTSGLYYAEQWPAIIDGIRQLKDEGRGDVLIALGDVFGVRAESGSWNNQTEVNLAINCNDEQRRTPAEEEQLRQDTFDASPFMDPGRPVEGVTRDACEDWPSEPTLGFPYAQDVEELPESLVISVTGDPVTPFEAGQSLADSLGGTVLEVEGERHTVFQAGLSPCVTEAAVDYLVDLEMPDPELRCEL